MKFYKTLLLLVAISAVQFLSAQTFWPVKDAATLQNRISDASAKISTIKCDFVQEKNMSMLAERSVSKGKFYFKKESKVRLEYLQPLKNLIVMNMGKMMMKDDKKTSQMDMHRSKVFQQLNNIIVGSINGSLFNGKDFKVSFLESNAVVRVELKPISKMLKNFLSTIILSLDKKDFTATKIEMNEASGDNTILTFSNKEINVQVEEALFAVK